MPITQEASGTQTAVIGTEHVLATIATAKTFVAVVRIAPIVASEYVQLRVRRRVLSGGPTDVIFSKTYSWLEAAIRQAVTLPVDASGGGRYEVTLRQLNGTGRDFPWAIETPD